MVARIDSRTECGFFTFVFFSSAKIFSPKQWQIAASSAMLFSWLIRDSAAFSFVKVFSKPVHLGSNVFKPSIFEGAVGGRFVEDVGGDDNPSSELHEGYDGRRGADYGERIRHGGE